MHLMTTTPELPAGYHLIDRLTSVVDYLTLRRQAGLSPKTEVQAIAPLPGSWFARHVTREGSGQAVGMGRVIGRSVLI